MSVKRRITRNIEVATGILMIISVLSMLIAFLLNFDYSVPNATLEEDVEFMAESISRQRFSGITWLIAGVVNLALLPFYLILFSRFQKGMHIFNSFLLLGIAFSFFTLGLIILETAGISQSKSVLSSLQGDASSLSLLSNIRNSILLTHIGITFFGSFSTVFTISRFSEVKFPVFGSTLAFLAGPLVITFTWLNPEHILLNASLALSWTGLLIIGVRLANKGLELKRPD